MGRAPPGQQSDLGKNQNFSGLRHGAPTQSFTSLGFSGVQARAGPARSQHCQPSFKPFQNRYPVNSSRPTTNQPTITIPEQLESLEPPNPGDRRPVIFNDAPPNPTKLSNYHAPSVTLSTIFQALSEPLPHKFFTSYHQPTLRSPYPNSLNHLNPQTPETAAPLFSTTHSQTRPNFQITTRHLSRFQPFFKPFQNRYPVNSSRPTTKQPYDRHTRTA